MARQVKQDDDRSREGNSGQAPGRDPERQEVGGKRLQADETRVQQLGADTDNDLGDERD
jgi:hypothetical protein